MNDLPIAARRLMERKAGKARRGAALSPQVQNEFERLIAEKLFVLRNAQQALGEARAGKKPRPIVDLHTRNAREASAKLKEVLEMLETAMLASRHRRS